jgi:hypothetical protein
VGLKLAKASITLYKAFSKTLAFTLSSGIKILPALNDAVFSVYRPTHLKNLHIQVGWV